LGQNKKFSDQYRLAKQAQIDNLLHEILEIAADDSPNDWSIVRVKTAKPAAWSTATIFDEPSFGSRPESRTSRGPCPYKAQRLIGAAPAGFRRCSRSGSLAKFAAIPSDLPDRIASVFLLLLLFGKQIDYQLSV
jgi:hypothetical protein